MNTHDDDAVVIQANRYIATSKDRATTDLVRQLLNRIGEKKVEMRGLEGQVKTLQERVKQLEIQWTHPRNDGDSTDLNWVPPEGGDPSQK